MMAYRQYGDLPLTISGQVGGHPSPITQWFKDGILLSSETSRVQLFPASIIFSRVEEKDNGSYTFSATNSEGSVSFNITLIAICKKT